MTYRPAVKKPIDNQSASKQDFMEVSHVAPLAAKRIDAMNEANNGFDLTEEQILSYEISDETLEAAAASGPEYARAFTITMCTGQSECPF